MRFEFWIEKFYRWVTNPVITVTIVFFLLLIISFGTSSFGMSYDEGFWNYIGFAWFEHNVPPYVGAMDNKNPAIYLLYGISYVLFGANYWFPRFLGILSLMTTSIVIFMIGRKLHSHMAGILAMLLFGLTITWKSTGGRFTAETESFLILFSVLAFYILILAFFSNRKESPIYILRLFLVGICMGTAVAFKQSAVFTAGGLVSFYIIMAVRNSFSAKKILRDLLIILTGVIVLTAISLMPLFLSDLTLADYYRGAWLILFQKGSPTTVPIVARISRFIETFKQTPFVLFYPLLFLFILQRRKLVASGIPFWGFLIWIIFDFIAVSSAGTYATHHLRVLVPSVALASGIAVSSIFESNFINESERSRRFVQLIIIITILWFPIYIEPLAAAKKIIMSADESNRSLVLCEEPYPKPEENDLKQTGLWIKENTQVTDLVYVAGLGATIQAYSERISPSRYFDAMFVRTQGANVELQQDLQNKSPKLILVPNHHKYKEWVPSNIRIIVANIIQEKYRFKLCYYGYNIYERISNED